MSQSALRRVTTEYWSYNRFINRFRIIRTLSPSLRVGERALSGPGGQEAGRKAFDPSLLQFLVCPLSKKPLRYNEATNELINEELGIAYPVLDGIPNMIPQDARLIKTTEGAEKPTPTDS